MLPLLGEYEPVLTNGFDTKTLLHLWFPQTQQLANLARLVCLARLHGQ